MRVNVSIESNSIPYSKTTLFDDSLVGKDVLLVSEFQRLAIDEGIAVVQHFGERAKVVSHFWLPAFHEFACQSVDRVSLGLTLVVFVNREGHCVVRGEDFWSHLLSVHESV